MIKSADSCFDVIGSYGPCRLFRNGGNHKRMVICSGRIYKKLFGIPFNEELISFRLDRAKYLLKNTSLSVQRIAEECGYTNSAHFMRQFRERENMSAGQYRKTDE